jgi:hypothetical protein
MFGRVVGSSLLSYTDVLLDEIAIRQLYVPARFIRINSTVPTTLRKRLLRKMVITNTDTGGSRSSRTWATVPVLSAVAAALHYRCYQCRVAHCALGYTTDGMDSQIPDKPQIKKSSSGACI